MLQPDCYSPHHITVLGFDHICVSLGFCHSSAENPVSLAAFVSLERWSARRVLARWNASWCSGRSRAALITQVCGCFTDSKAKRFKRFIPQRCEQRMHLSPSALQITHLYHNPRSTEDNLNTLHRELESFSLTVTSWTDCSLEVTRLMLSDGEWRWGSVNDSSWWITITIWNVK